MRLATAFLLAFSTFAAAQSVTPVQMPGGVHVRDSAYADVNGDGRMDLVISTYGPALEMRIHLQRDGARPFVAEPDHLLSPVWKDVVAFAVADVHPDEGAEVVLLTSKAVWAWRTRAGEKERAVKLLDCSLIWQLPYSHGPLHWHHVIQDLDGNGRADLALPEPGGYRIAIQRAPGQFSDPQDLNIPAAPTPKRAVPVATDRQSARKMRDRMRTQLSSGGGMTVESLRDSGALVEVNDRLPAPQFRDWDADGDLDLILRTRRWVHVWLQTKPGYFDETRLKSFAAPVEADLARRLEVSYSDHVLDLDGDQRTDCVVFSGDQRSKDVRTQVQFFRQEDGSALFGKAGLPDQLLVLSGFAGSPRFDDVDGDGDPDLLVGALRPDLLDSLRGAGKTSLDVELYLFRNERGVFSRKPDLAYRTEVQAQGLRPGRKGLMARFFGDASGDGLSDLLLRDQPGRLQVLLTRRGRSGWSIHSQPLWELRIHPNSWIVIGTPRGKRKAPDLLILEDVQVLHVRFP